MECTCSFPIEETIKKEKKIFNKKGNLDKKKTKIFSIKKKRMEKLEEKSACPLCNVIMFFEMI